MSELSPQLQGLLVALETLASDISELLYVAAPDARRSPLFVSAGIETMLGYTAAEWVADPDLFWHSLHPSDRPAVETALAAWTRQGPLQLRYRLLARDGRHVFCRETTAASLDGPAGPQLQGIISDVTELQVLQDVLGAVVGAVDPRLSLAIFCDGLAAMLGLDFMGFVDACSREGLSCAYGPLAERTSMAWVRHPTTGTLVTSALADGGVAWTARPAPGALPPALGVAPGAAFAFTAAVPGVDGRVRGVLVGAGRRTRPLDQRERRIIEAVSRQASLALQRADLVAELERIGAERKRLAESVVMAHEDERRRIASELHDGAGQTLMAAVIQIDLASQAGQVPAAQKALARAREQVEQTLEDLRGLAHALRPAALDKLGLPDALREMGRALASGALSLDVDVPPTAVQLEPELSTAIFRIAQAALTNVARHAKARRASLRLDVDEAAGRVVLEVEDDGRGFRRAPLIEGIGLVAMRERAQAVGGEVTVESREGGGTRVSAVIPLGRRR